MKKLNVVWMMIFLFMISGCVQPRILDDEELVQAVGYDMAPDHKITGTIVVPVFQSTKKSGVAIVRSVTTETSKNIRMLLSAKSARPVISGQVRVFLFSKKLAETKGISPILDTLYRDPSVGSRVFLTIVDGNVKGLLSKNYHQSENIAIFISDLLSQNMKVQNQPNSNFHTFLNQYFGNGMDPYLPIIQSKGNEIKIKGIALFRRDKMINEIPLERNFIFKMLVEKHRGGSIQFIYSKNPKKYSVVDNISGHSTYSFSHDSQGNWVNITIKMSGELRELTEKIERSRVVKLNKIQKQLEESMKKQAEQMIVQFQSQQIDPLALGQKYLIHHRRQSFKDWYNVYPRLHVRVKAKVKIVQAGVVD